MKKKNAHNKGKVLRTNIFGQKYYTSKPIEIIKSVLGVQGLLMLAMLFFHVYGLYLTYQPEQELLSPIPVQAKEVEPTPKPIVEPTPTPKPEFTIEGYIREVFGEHAEEALIIADCESKMNPEAHGDTALLVVNGKDIVGDSIGLFQIRTGGKDFNRARANGMSPDEFREWMWDAKSNIEYAKEIFDRQGWSPWTCKKDL